MSLNGDITIIRNGRSSSQVSVYNYPEHLNPFYEDDQHKRLRFWQINKKHDNDGRRNSFSIGGLKDIWVFKSFRLKKKSSTLGINKTSESPPPLRREVVFGALANNGYTSANRVSADGTSFQRNVPYRSSLQNMSSSPAPEQRNGFGFNRNNQYRSTMQNTSATRSQQHSLTMPQPRRYVYGGSVTPQPFRSAEFGRGDLRETHIRGSSQISINTNPFDTDDEDDRECAISLNDSAILDTSASSKRTPRKKRRAPAPPTLVHEVYNDRSALHILESSQQISKEENLNIANLTAEIESFVKTTNSTENSENTRVTTNDRIQPKPTVRTSKLNGAIPKESPRIEVTSAEPAGKEWKHSCSEETCEPNVVKRLEESNKQAEREVGQVECIHIHLDNVQTAKLERSEPSRVTSFRADPKSSPKKILRQTAFTLSSPPPTRQATDSTTTSSTVVGTAVVISEPNELKITEDRQTSNGTILGHATCSDSCSTNDGKPAIATKPALAQIHKLTLGLSSSIELKHEMAESATDSSQPKAIENSNHKSHTNVTFADVKSVEINPIPPLKIVEKIEDTRESSSNKSRSSLSGSTGEAAIYRAKPTTQLEWKKSTLAPLETNVPPEKRKSVKEIIESINRSQRLLNASAHKDELATLNYLKDFESSIKDEHEELPIASKLESRKISLANNLNQSNKRLGAAQQTLDKENGGALEQLPNQNKEQGSSASLDKTERKSSNNDPQKLDNDEIFKKCKVDKEVYDYRETSPTASNLDWNPVPKPKRTKHVLDL